MNKLILISLVIFFTICSKSWAGEADGKGIDCKMVDLDNGEEFKLKV
jgi:hypothetical protein